MCTTMANRSVEVAAVAQIDGRPVLQPACNRVASLESRKPAKKILSKCPPPLPTITTSSPTNSIKAYSTPHRLSPPISPKSKSPRPSLKRCNDPNGLSLSTEKPLTPKPTPKSTSIVKKKPAKSVGTGAPLSPDSSLNCSSLIVKAPGSIAAARREQVTLMHAQRKMRIAHYGRKMAKLEGKVVPVDSTATVIAPTSPSATIQEEKRCSFITPNSDPLYVAYHDKEWGVSVHDDKMLFELLVLTGAQVGLDWTSILRKRHDFRAAFSGFDAEIVANFTERQITSISVDYGIDLTRVRSVVDNSNRILEVRRKFGSFDKYLWGFVNNKPICTQYRSCRKIPVKTSKSETISKDMVKRGFRFVGPTVMHSFMQAAGLTNDHLLTCPRHLQCLALASHQPIVAPAL